MRDKLERKNVPEAAQAETIAEMVNEGISQARNLARGLYPVRLEVDGLSSALEELAASAQARNNVSCHFSCDEQVLIHDEVAGNNLYRIAQEAVNNAVKHGRGRNISIGLGAVEDEVTLTVKDDGIGFPETPRRPQRHGPAHHELPGQNDRRLPRYPARGAAAAPLSFVPSTTKRSKKMSISTRTKPEKSETAARTKVFLVDDHPLVREWLTQLIQRESDLAVCGEAEDTQEALEKINETKPDIVIADISLKTTHGLELVKDLQVRFPSLPVLILSMHDESLYAERVLRAGAKGYITKQEATKKILPAIRQVLAGQIYISEKMASRMVHKMVLGRAEEQKSPIERLTDRELEVFQLIGCGQGTRRIASELHLGIKTVESYRARIKEKLKLDDGTQLLQQAIQWVHSLKDR